MENSTMGKAVISTSHRGIVYEDRKDFPRSVFERVYRRAYSLVQESVELQLKKDERQFYDADAAPDNLVTFIGRRGTGKSSAMLSFMNALCDNCKEEESRKFDQYTVYENQDRKKLVRFLSIDWIDASMLEKGEDIFELVLAKMYHQFLHEIETDVSESLNYEKRDLNNRFASIYKKHLNIKAGTTDTVFSSETAMSNLRDIARSVDIRKEFQELVSRYVKNREESRSGDRYQTFLVLAIDDLDMNVDYGFEILEKIQRYLKVDRLLVLLAVNHEQMKMCCQKHFTKVYSDYAGILAEDTRTYVKEKIVSLAGQYMEKSLPAYARIYLPSLKKKDYDRQRLTKIQMTIETRSEECSIKRAVFLLSAQKTMVRYDVEGKKRHFMEPTSLRKLNDFFIFRENLEKLPAMENKTGFLLIFNRNYRRCMDDLLFRYADEFLTEKEARFFLELSETDIQRRGEAIVRDFLIRIARKTRKEMLFYEMEADGKNFHHVYQTEFDLFKYSYGELLRTFYFLGREEIYGRNLVSALLAMYSLTLTKIFYQYRLGENVQSRRNYETMKGILGGSAAGSWGRHLFPALTIDVSWTPGHIYYAGAAKDVSLEGSAIGNEEVAQAIDGLFAKTDWERETFIQKFAGVCDSMQGTFLLFLFLTVKKSCVFRYTGKHPLANEVLGGAGYRETKASALVIEDGTADYNILNFVNNIYLYREVLASFVTDLLRIKNVKGNHLYEMVKGWNCDKENDELKKLSEDTVICLQKNSEGFYGEMDAWIEKTGGAVVPFYAADLFYNMLKRLARKQSLYSKSRIRESELFGSLLELLESIQRALWENDRWYQDGEYAEEPADGTENLSESKKSELKQAPWGCYGSIFESCPAIQKLREKENGTWRMESYFNEFIKWIVVKDKNQKTDEEHRMSVLLGM